MSEKLENNKRPFAEELSSTLYGKENKLFELKSRPHVVVRLDRWVNISTKERLSEAVEKLNENKALFASLEENGVRVAKFDYVIGGKKDQEGFAESYALVEKIDGKNLDAMGTFDAQAIEAIDQCYADYLKHVLRILAIGGRYWSDMRTQQIVYGTRESDDVPHAYVVDIDPFVGEWMDERSRNDNPPKAISDVLMLIGLLQCVLTDIVHIEKKAEHKARLEEARAKLREVLVWLNALDIQYQPSDFNHYVSSLQTGLQEK